MIQRSETGSESLELSAAPIAANPSSCRPPGARLPRHIDRPAFTDRTWSTQKLGGAPCFRAFFVQRGEGVLPCRQNRTPEARRESPNESNSGEPAQTSSFAGLATAYWMNRLGYRVTVIEVASGLRKGGTPVDIEGEAIRALAHMGIVDAVRAKALPPRGLEFKDTDDSTVGALEGHSVSDDEPNEKYEIHRDDLLEILFASVKASSEVAFGRSITQLEDGPDEVVVTFIDGSQRGYALVFGCDGARSNTRLLAFGGAEDFSYFMGGYFFIKVVPTAALLPANMSQIFSVPNRTALLNGYDYQTDIAFAFRSDREIDYDYRDRAQQRRIVHDHFDELGWKMPTMLDYLDADDEFYFDKLNQVRMPVWSKGRVALVGDAGYCVSPVAGMGGSMGIIGAARLDAACQERKRASNNKKLDKINLSRGVCRNAIATNKSHNDWRAGMADKSSKLPRLIY